MTFVYDLRFFDDEIEPMVIKYKEPTDKTKEKSEKKEKKEKKGKKVKVISKDN